MGAGSPFSQCWRRKLSDLPPLVALKIRERKVHERDIEAKVRKYAIDRGFLVYKFTDPTRAGVPDRIFISPQGNLFFVEFQAPGKKPRANQLAEHKRLQEHGQYVYIVDDVERGKRLIDSYD